MAQSQPSPERTFIAVDFRGIQQSSRERSSLTVVGAAGLATFATLPAPLPEPAEREPDAEARPQVLGETTALVDLGGEGARAAYVYAALGGLVRLGATVGQDAGGDLLLRWLEERGAGTDAIRRVGRTPVTVHLAPPAAQPLALVPAPNPDKGDQGEAVSRATAALGERGSALLLAGYPFTGALRGPGAVALFRAARERGVRTVLSLSPVALGGPGQPLSRADLEPLLPLTDLLCGRAAELRRATRSADSQVAAASLIAAGAGSVLAKRGPEGAAVFRPGPAALEREDTSTAGATGAFTRPTGPDGAGGPVDPWRETVAFGALYDAAYLLAVAQNDGSPVRFAAAAATRVALSPSGVLGI